MDLVELQRHWDTFGRQDPFWAILTDPSRRGNRWPVDEFFETGRLEVAELMRDAERLGVPRARLRALDFGCGAGRLTQALGDHFETVLGIDVAPSMIDLARAHNRHGARCAYEVNDRPDLSRWPDQSFNLIYTSRVLQHIEPRYSTAYVREFVRVLAPGGYLSFDLPAGSGDAVALAEGTVPTSAMRARVRVIEGPGSGAIAGEESGSHPGSRANTAALGVGAAQKVPFRVRVTNLSDVPWFSTPTHPINVGNHWLARDGTVVAYDDARAALPAVVAPGAEAEVDIAVTAPSDPGAYRLQFDVVQEGVAWFATCGSELAEVEVRAEPAHAPVAVPTRRHQHSDPDAPAVSPAESRPTGDDKASVAAREGPTAQHGRVPVPQAADSPADPLEPVMEMHAVPREQVEAILADAGARLLDVRRVHHCGPLWLAYRYDVTRS